MDSEQAQSGRDQETKIKARGPLLTSNNVVNYVSGLW